MYPEKIEKKVPSFAKKLSKLHPHGWNEVVDRIRKMLVDLGENPPLKMHDFSYLDHSIRLHVGDRDITAGVDSTMQVYERLTMQNFVYCQKHRMQ